MNKHHASIILLLAIVQFVAANFSFSTPNFQASNFVTLGMSRVNTSGIRITEEGDPLGSLMFHRFPVAIANGFTTSFTIDIINCDVPYGGADGFAFVMFPEIPARNAPLIGGSGISLTAVNNYVAIPFLLGRDAIGFCAINSSSAMQAGALWDETFYCDYNSSLANALSPLRCTGPHTIDIQFSPPDQWEVTIDSTFVYYATKNLSLLDWNYNAYVGFSGGVAQGFMNQYITAWSITVVPGCLGICDPIAICVDNNAAICECPGGYFGDGTSCALIAPEGADVVPILECFEDLGDSNYRAYFGYQNNEEQSVSIPKGATNQFIGTNPTNLPTLFQIGRSPFYPLSAFQHDFSGTNLISWRLTNYNLTVDVTDTSKLCPTDLSVELKFYTSSLVERYLIRERLSQDLEISIDRITIANVTYASLNSKKRADVEIAQLEIEIAGTNSTTQAEPSASDAVEDFVNTAQNAAAIEQIVNPADSDPTREFVSVKPLPTGVESEGQVVPVSPDADVPSVPSAPTSSNAPIRSTPSSGSERITQLAAKLFCGGIALVTLCLY